MVASRARIRKQLWPNHLNSAISNNLSSCRASAATKQRTNQSHHGACGGRFFRKSMGAARVRGCHRSAPADFPRPLIGYHDEWPLWKSPEGPFSSKCSSKPFVGKVPSLQCDGGFLHHLARRSIQVRAFADLPNELPVEGRDIVW